MGDRTNRRTYYLGNKNGHHFEVKVTPTASSTVGPGGSVFVTASATPITLTLTGPVSDQNGALKLAVGQKLTAQVGGLAGQNDTYSWSTPSGGRPFLNYVASSSSAVFTEYANPATSSSSMSCFYGKAESAVIQCTYHSAQYNVDVPLQKSIVIVGPVRDEKRHDIYLMQLLKGSSSDTVWTSGSPYPNAYMLWGAVYTDPVYGLSVWGMYQVDTLLDPEPLSPGSGTWGYVQTKDRKLFVDDVEIEHVTGPDGGFPHGDYTNSNGWISADGTTRRRFRDKPGAADITQVFPLDLRIEGNYDLYIFYKPVNSAAGSSVYVPIRFIPWAVKGECASQT